VKGRILAMKEQAQGTLNWIEGTIDGPVAVELLHKLKARKS